MVPLPKTTANTAATIGTMLLAAAAQEKKLTPMVAAAVAGLQQANAALCDAIGSAFAPGGDALHRTESLEEGNCWAATELWLSGIARAPIDTAPTAQALHNQLFADGLVFVRLATPDRWAQTDGRLNHIKKNKLEADFATLGGTKLLDALKLTHAATGHAAGITVPRPAMPSVIGSAFDAWKAAAKSLVAQVMAMADHEKTDAANALAARLLDALASFDSTQTAAVPVEKPATDVPATGATKPPAA